MPGMKITLDAAMRARDISRPHAEHERLAREGEPDPASEQGQTTAPSGASRGAHPRADGPAPPASTADAAEAATMDAAPKPASGRRRRRRR
jgi:hypothetical protein